MLLELQFELFSHAHLIGVLFLFRSFSTLLHSPFILPTPPQHHPLRLRANASHLPSTSRYIAAFGGVSGSGFSVRSFSSPFPSSFLFPTSTFQRYNPIYNTTFGTVTIISDFFHSNSGNFSSTLER